MAHRRSEITQIVILSIPQDISLEDATLPEGAAWKGLLNILKKSVRYQRLYWGRQVEDPGKVQLHIVRDTIEQHLNFQPSPAGKAYESLVAKVATGEAVIRYAAVSEFSPGCDSLGKGSPVTGTAIYLSTRPEWDAAWANWVGIVQHVPGFLGIAGGPMIGGVDGHENAFIALVGWQSVEVHNAYHHTRHFLDRRMILLDPCEGYRYYGHIAFGSSGLEGGGRNKL